MSCFASLAVQTLSLDAVPAAGESVSLSSEGAQDTAISRGHPLTTLLNISHARHIDVDMISGNVYLAAGHPDQLHCLDQHGNTVWVRAVPEAGGVC